MAERALDTHDAQSDDELIARYIEMNPNCPGPLGARTVEYAVPVWAIAGYCLLALHGDLDQTAADYEVSRATVEAVMAYYRRYQGAIDALIEANSAQ